MPFNPNRRTVLLSGAAALSVVATTKPSLASTAHEVQMLNKHPEDSKLRQVFYPRIIVVEPGDTVNFVSVDKSHNSVSVDGMLPADVEEWKGGVSKDIEVTFDKPGFYGYQCTPHSTLGMVGLVIVKGEGMMDNLEDAQSVRQRGKAKKAWEEIWEEVEGMQEELTA
ncbi:MAG: pseudoazurin [Pseudomonadota bacterium]